LSRTTGAARGRRRRGLRFVAAAGTVAAVLAAGTATATAGTDAVRTDAGSIGMRLLDAPTATRDDPRARVYVVDHLAPGAAIDRRVEVSNTTGAPLQVVLYAAAASVTGGAFLGAAGHTPNDLSTWTTVAPSSMQVPPGGRVTGHVRIDVPRDAAPGEQYAAVWAEARSGKDGGGVTQVSRVGLRLYVSVGSGGAPAAEFSIDQLRAARAQDGTASVVASVHNTGGRAVDMSGVLRLTDGPGGISAGPFPARLGTTLAPGSTEPVTVVLDGALPSGRWKAQITLRSGLLERQAAAVIVIPDSGQAAPAAVGTSTPSRRPPYAEVVVGVLGAMVLAATGVAARRRLRGRRPVSTGRHVKRRA
jgi:hypothetical protein